MEIKAARRRRPPQYLPGDVLSDGPDARIGYTAATPGVTDLSTQFPPDPLTEEDSL
jgi:hypothetical protein